MRYRCVLAALTLIQSAFHESRLRSRPNRCDGCAPGRLRVGAPGRELKRPSEAARVARDGDVVEIDAGVYAGDAAVWPQHRLTIRGVGGRAHLRANGAHAEGKAIWVIKGHDTTVERVEFSGAGCPPQRRRHPARRRRAHGA